jgi:hypothetical protein
MVKDLIELSNHPESGFTSNHDELIETLLALDQAGQNVILIGVTFALLDLIENAGFNCNIPSLWKPGMKGRRKEMIRENYMSNFVQVLAFQPSILNMV